MLRSRRTDRWKRRRYLAERPERLEADAMRSREFLKRLRMEGKSPPARKTSPVGAAWSEIARRALKIALGFVRGFEIEEASVYVGVPQDVLREWIELGVVSMTASGRLLPSQIVRLAQALQSCKIDPETGGYDPVEVFEALGMMGGGGRHGDQREAER